MNERLHFSLNQEPRLPKAVSIITGLLVLSGITSLIGIVLVLQYSDFIPSPKVQLFRGLTFYGLPWYITIIGMNLIVLITAIGLRCLKKWSFIGLLMLLLYLGYYSFVEILQHSYEPDLLFFLVIIAAFIAHKYREFFH